MRWKTRPTHPEKGDLVWTPIRLCECCGRLIVLLNVRNPAPDRPKRIPCYFKAWAGSPWYRQGIDQRHRSKKWSMQYRPPKPPTEEDVFFALE